MQEIDQQNRGIAEISGSGAQISESRVGCVKLTKQMKAVITAYPLEELAISSYHSNIRKLSSGRPTIWGWKITARKTGEPTLSLALSYAISGGDADFRSLKNPVYEEAIKVTPPQTWWQRIFERISEIFGA